MSTCPLTGQPVNMIQLGSKMEYHYETQMLGKVIVSDLALMAVPNLSESEKYILSGICRNASINGNDPTNITLDLTNKLNEQNIPYGFEERARHLLKYFYDNGGKEFRDHSMNSTRDCSITYSSPYEFTQIIKYLKAENWLEYNEVIPTKSGTFYQGLLLTKSGIQEIEKGLAKMPMYGLVNEGISTGDQKVDANIEHARIMFFGQNSSLESKRTACETLSFVLEPLREDLKEIVSGDTDHFFNIVNNFSIRHNKVSTKKVEHQEQLEWIFYSLLNTINTYVKMRNKLN